MNDSRPKSLLERAAKINKSRSGLILDGENYKPSKLRSDLYKELSKDDVVIDENDAIKFSHPLMRFIALVIDLGFLYGLIMLAFLISPLELKLVHLFLDNYKLQFILGDLELHHALTGVSIFLGIFFLVVCPSTFFKKSLGKKITRQKICGSEMYTLTIIQIFKREIIYKPIGILLLFGFIMPFTNKRKQSFHDKMMKTYVITE